MTAIVPNGPRSIDENRAGRTGSIADGAGGIADGSAVGDVKLAIAGASDLKQIAVGPCGPSACSIDDDCAGRAGQIADLALRIGDQSAAGNGQFAGTGSPDIKLGAVGPSGTGAFDRDRTCRIRFVADVADGVID